MHTNPAQLLMRLWRARPCVHTRSSLCRALPSTQNGASAFFLKDGFQRITDLDLFITSAFVFHHFISAEQDLLGHLGGNLGLHPNDDTGVTCCRQTWRFHGAVVGLCKLVLFSHYQHITLAAVPRCCWSFWCRKENSKTVQENLSLLISVQKGEQHHVGSAQPRALVGTKKGQTGVFKWDV